MQISEALTKKIMETSYLTAVNADRYRVILRYFYEEYEKIHYWLNKEDVFDMMLKIGLFPDSTLNQCQLDRQVSESSACAAGLFAKLSVGSAGGTGRYPWPVRAVSTNSGPAGRLSGAGRLYRQRDCRAPAADSGTRTDTV